MSERLLLGIDEGTTAVKVALFDERLAEVAAARRPVAVTHPAPGRVEQDPEAVLAAVVDAVAEVIGTAPPGAEVIATGLDHQGESVLAWEAETLRPLTKVIVWQDKRCEALLGDVDPRASGISGLPLDPYFSAGKIAWLLAHDEAVGAAASDGTLRLGTVDSYLCARLGAPAATDLSTASRTLLLALGGTDWDDELLSIFGVRREWLPALAPTFGELGELRHERWPIPLPLRARLVDQQAALAGSGAVRPGQLKATYGTGVFVLGRTPGPTRVEGLLPTVAWASAAGGSDRIGEVSYALDGGVFAAGSLLQWMAGGLGLAPDAAAFAALGEQVADSGGVQILPAIAGLGSPWWQPEARGVIAGLTGATRAPHLARAALEAIAWRVAEIVRAMGAAGPVESLRIDGGLTNSGTLRALQASALSVPVLAGPADATVLGAALLAGVGGGLFDGVEGAVELLPASQTVQSRVSAAEREHGFERWRSFAGAAATLTRP